MCGDNLKELLKSNETLPVNSLFLPFHLLHISFFHSALRLIKIIQNIFRYGFAVFDLVIGYVYMRFTADRFASCSANVAYFIACYYHLTGLNENTVKMRVIENSFAFRIEEFYVVSASEEICPEPGIVGRKNNSRYHGYCRHLPAGGIFEAVRIFINNKNIMRRMSFKLTALEVAEELILVILTIGAVGVPGKVAHRKYPVAPLCARYLVGLEFLFAQLNIHDDRIDRCILIYLAVTDKLVGSVPALKYALRKNSRGEYPQEKK